MHTCKCVHTAPIFCMRSSSAAKFYFNSRHHVNHTVSNLSGQMTSRKQPDGTTQLILHNIACPGRVALTTAMAPGHSRLPSAEDGQSPHIAQICKSWTHNVLRRAITKAEPPVLVTFTPDEPAVPVSAKVINKRTPQADLNPVCAAICLIVLHS